MLKPVFADLVYRTVLGYGEHRAFILRTDVPITNRLPPPIPIFPVSVLVRTSFRGTDSHGRRAGYCSPTIHVDQLVARIEANRDNAGGPRIAERFRRVFFTVPFRVTMKMFCSLP